MKSLKNLQAGILVCANLLWVSCNGPGAKEAQDAETITQEELISRGEYLVTSVGCADCHAPKIMTEQGPEPDMDRYLMGFPATDSLPPIPEGMADSPWILFYPELTAVVGPWGISYAANLTPDDTGLGTWTLDQFKRAIREGKYKGLENSRPLMPPMPWQAYRNFSDQDLEAIFTYLKTLKPISNVVPAYQPPTP